jgi:nicotinic acid phosphoribosyltransferase
MINDIEVSTDKIENETMVTFKFKDKWKFDYLRFDSDDNDYVLYLNLFIETKNIFSIKRVWIKTLCEELRNKKIMFNDIEYYEDMIKIYFLETV